MTCSALPALHDLLVSDLRMLWLALHAELQLKNELFLSGEPQGACAGMPVQACLCRRACAGMPVQARLRRRACAGMLARACLCKHACAGMLVQACHMRSTLQSTRCIANPRNLPY